MKNLVIISFLLFAGCISTSFDTRVYLVNEYFWNSFAPVFKVASGDFVHVGKSDKINEDMLVEFLEKAGVPFPKGTLVKFDREKNTVTARNTSERLIKMENILHPLGSGEFYVRRLK